MSNPRPEKNPPHRTTPDGVIMSPRASRIYGWLNARGIRITTFSTDTMVDEWMRSGQLQRALDDLHRWQAGVSDALRPQADLPSAGELAAMERDLIGIMGRGSAQRITSTEQARKAPGATSAVAGTGAEDNELLANLKKMLGGL